MVASYRAILPVLCRDPKKSALAVIAARDAGIIGPLEQSRFKYRRYLVAVGSHHVQIMTYDDMVRRMDESLTTAKT